MFSDCTGGEGKERIQKHTHTETIWQQRQTFSHTKGGGGRWTQLQHIRVLTGHHDWRESEQDQVPEESYEESGGKAGSAKLAGYIRKEPSK